MSEDRREAGMTVRRSVLGNEHVDNAEAAKTDFDAGFQRYITENVWGDLWASDALTRRERSLVTLGILAAIGHEEEVAMHVKASANTGATKNDIAEVFRHVAAYAGVPAARRAFLRAKAIFAEGGGPKQP